MDDTRLKALGGGGYFKELLYRIRDIRASENGEFDYIALAQSPNYTHTCADYIIDIVREYIKEI